MRGSFFSRLLWKSLVQRRGRSAITLAALVLGASLVAALLSVSLDLGRKAGAQLQAYGANMLLLPEGGSRTLQGETDAYLAEDQLGFLQSEQEAGSIQFAPYLYGIVEASGQKVVLGGTRLEASSPLASWWKVEGNWPDPGDPIQALVGVGAARALGIQSGDILALRYGTSTLQLHITGLVETGGSEDSQVLAQLLTVQRLLGRDKAVGIVQIRTQAGVGLEDLVRSMEEEVPGSEARIVGQVAQAEEQVLGKIQLLMALVTVLVLVASSLAVSSTLATAVLERIPEIGLMKALGARNMSIASLFLGEVLGLGFLGGLLGYGLGFLLAQGVGQSVFASAISPRLEVLALTLVLAVGLALACCLFPMRRALNVQPALTLKGD